MQPSLLIGRVGGTEIRLHWTMILIFPYVILAFQPESLMGTWRVLLIVAMVFLSVLLHEIGHLVVARMYHVRVSSVVLWALGGAAVTDHEPEDPGAQLQIAAAGPAANLLITAVMLICLAGGTLLAQFTAVGSISLQFLRNLIFLAGTNFILAVSNLLPIYPLDGGRIFKAFIHMFAGPVRSVRITFWISVGLAVGLGLIALVGRSWVIFITALLLLFGAFSLNQGLNVAIQRLYARFFNRADIFLQLADYDPAIAILTARIDQDPGNPDLYLQRAYAHFFLDDFLQARADADRSLSLDPDFLPGILLRGSVAYALGAVEDAWRMVERGEKVRPNSSIIHLNRCVLLRDAGRLEEALVEANRAIGQASGEKGSFASPVLAHLVRSLVLFRMGDREGAEADWSAALRAGPRESVVFTPDRARIFARDWEWAEAYFTWLQTALVDRFLLPVSQGEVALRAGQFERAAVEFGDAMRRHPSLSDLCYYRGLAYLGQGKREEAAEDFLLAQRVTQHRHIHRMASAQLKDLQATGILPED